jgi:hypothetical protein
MKLSPGGGDSGSKKYERDNGGALIRLASVQEVTGLNVVVRT